jgi:hypothetical protein
LKYRHVAQPSYVCGSLVHVADCGLYFHDERGSVKSTRRPVPVFRDPVSRLPTTSLQGFLLPMASNVLLTFRGVDVHRIYWTFCTAFAAAPSGTILRFPLPEFGGDFRVTRTLPFASYVSTGHRLLRLVSFHSFPAVGTLGVSISATRPRFAFATALLVVPFEVSLLSRHEISCH